MPAHSFAFFLLGLVAAAETGLLGYLVHKFEDDGYPSGRGTNGSPTQMRILIILLLFTAAWTTFFAVIFACFVFGGTLGALAGLGASLAWLVITIILWAVSTTLFHKARIGGECVGSATMSTCRQLEAVEALGWTALGLCVLCILAAFFGWRSYRTYRRTPHRV